MNSFDYLLLAVAAGVLIYQLTLFRRVKREVIIPGKAPHKRTVGVVMGLLLVLAAFRARSLQMNYGILAVLALICLLVLLNGSGLSERGMYNSGAFIPFDHANYYEIVDQPDGSMQFRLSRLTKEGHMQFDPAREGEILDLMERKGVPTFEQYQQSTSRRVGQRMAARQSKKKKKKK